VPKRALSTVLHQIAEEFVDALFDTIRRASLTELGSLRDETVPRRDLRPKARARQRAAPSTTAHRPAVLDQPSVATLPQAPAGKAHRAGAQLGARRSAIEPKPRRVSAVVPAPARPSSERSPERKPKRVKDSPEPDLAPTASVVISDPALLLSLAAPVVRPVVEAPVRIVEAKPEPPPRREPTRPALREGEDVLRAAGGGIVLRRRARAK
jgi:hypothetical protein